MYLFDRYSQRYDKKYFQSGEEDKGKKKSVALMIETMKLEVDDDVEHPRKIHYIPSISEIALLIGYSSSTSKRKDSEVYNIYNIYLCLSNVS